MSSYSSIPRKNVMNTPARIAVVSLSFASVLAVLGGCFVSTPCDPGYFENSELQCEAVPAPAPEASASAEGGAGGGEAAAATSFGKTCAAQTDCSGDAPICGAPQLPYCTQVSCNPGEANAGVCPAGFTCVGAAPSACIKSP